MVTALSSVLRFAVHARSMLAVGTLVGAGVFAGPFTAPSGTPSSSSTGDTVLVEQPGRPAQPPDPRNAEVVATVAAVVPSVEASSAELVVTVAAEAPSVVPNAPIIPAPPAAPTVAVDDGETTAPSPARGSTAGAAEPTRTAASPSAGVPETCPANWFCYPRLGIAGPILPYSDCSGSTDIRGAIVSFTCLSSTYLIGHAYTQFGNITRWAAGDIVQANGVRYTVTGAITDRSCGAPSLPLARLSMQTSLGPSTCGPVLVVQAR